MGKQKTIIPSDKLELYDNLIASHPEIERKGKSNPYTSVNGHMFTFLSKEGSMGLRLSKEEREAFIKKYNSTLMIQYGSIMKEYVVIPDELLSNTKTIMNFLQKSFNYTKSLKPNPTKR